MPPLGMGPRLSATALLLGLGAVPTPPPIAAAHVDAPPLSRKRQGPTSSRSTIVEIVELLLDRALRTRRQNRLLGYFNATLPSANELRAVRRAAWAGPRRS